MKHPHNNQPPGPYTEYDKLYINGRWVTGRSSHVVKVTDPYDGSVLAEMRAASEEDLNEAFESAKNAQR
jgi:aldehyde dehydrogenase (NAD+)